MRARLPSKRAPGEFIRADDWNMLLDALAGIPEIRGGAGIVVASGARDVVIGLAKIMGEYARPARITAVLGHDGDRKSAVMYKAKALGETDTAETDFIAPRYLQIIPDEAAIVVAQEDDLCVIVRVPRGNGEWTNDLAVLTERLMPRVCDVQPPAAPAAGEELVRHTPDLTTIGIGGGGGGPASTGGPGSET